VLANGVAVLEFSTLNQDQVFATLAQIAVAVAISPSVMFAVKNTTEISARTATLSAKNAETSACAIGMIANFARIATKKWKVR
jgi:hypothetical protein